MEAEALHNMNEVAVSTMETYAGTRRRENTYPAFATDVVATAAPGIGTYITDIDVINAEQAIILAPVHAMP